MTISSFLKRKSDYIKFRIKNPKVKIINPLKIGTYYSQEGQDLYLSTLLFDEFKDKTEKNMVDIGCNDPEKFSNSLFFELFFKCNIIAIDPIKEYEILWNKTRPSATFIASAIGKSNGTVALMVPEKTSEFDDMFSSVTTKNSKIGDTKCTQRDVQLVTLDTIFTERKIKEVVLLSIDVEGAEVDVLQGIDFNKTYIKCILIENNSTSAYGSEEIRSILKDRGYIFLARIGFIDDVFLHNTLIDKLNRK